MNIMRKKVRLTKNQKGMTLIELMAVVVILGILAAVAGAAVTKGFDSSRTNADASSVKVISEAAQRYLMDNVGNGAADLTAATATASETALGKLQSAGYLSGIPKVQTKGETYFKISIDSNNIVTVVVD